MCDYEQCPACNAVQPLSVCTLGVLGNVTHLRCRYCGWQWSGHIDIPAEEYQPGDNLDVEA